MANKEQTKWFSCLESLPQTSGDYLVTFQLIDIRPIEVCYFDGNTWDKGGYDRVLAWMPLPEPYNEVR